MRKNLLGIATMMAVGMVTVTGQAYAESQPSYEPVQRVSYSTVQVDSDNVTREVWRALRAKGYVGRAGDGCECLYVPEGTRVGSWVAKRNRNTSKASAAREVLVALVTGKRVYEDYTFRGASENVSTWNDVFVDECRGKSQVRCLLGIIRAG